VDTVAGSFYFLKKRLLLAKWACGHVVSIFIVLLLRKRLLWITIITGCSFGRVLQEVMG
jgi:hypothetical protein